jgi:hypothetical protein
MTNHPNRSQTGRFFVLVMKGEETRRLDNRGRGYSTRQSAHDAAARYERRTGFVRIETRDTHDPAPRTSDARDWDAWRLRSGISGDHH